MIVLITAFLRTALFVFVALLLKLLFKEAALTWRISFYKKQKINTSQCKSFFTDVFNQLSFMLGLKHPVPHNNKYHIADSEFSEGDRRDVIIKPSNEINGKLEVILLGNQLIKDFFKIETDYTIKGISERKRKTLGFVMRGISHATPGRKLYKQVFRSDKLKLMVPHLRRLVQKHIKLMKNRIKETKSGRVKLTLIPEFIVPIMNDFSVSLLFGTDDLNEYKIDGLVFPMAVVKNVMLGLFPNTIDMLTGDILIKLGLSPKFNAFKAGRAKIRKLLEAEYKKRLNLKTSGDKNWEREIPNLLDILIKEFNEDDQLPSEKQFKDILEYMEVFLFAAADTSKVALNTFLSILSMERYKDYNKTLRKVLREELDHEYTYTELMENPTLDRYATESLRVLPVAGANFPRIIAKDFKLGDLKFKKGDAICVALMHRCSDPEYFENPFEFKPERWEGCELRKKLPALQFIPFSSGPRGCVGKLLAEFTLRLFSAEILKELDFELVDKLEKLSRENSFMREKRSILISVAEQ